MSKVDMESIKVTLARIAFFVLFIIVMTIFGTLVYVLGVKGSKKAHRALAVG